MSVEFTAIEVQPSHKDDPPQGRPNIGFADVCAGTVGLSMAVGARIIYNWWTHLGPHINIPDSALESDKKPDQTVLEQIQSFGHISPRDEVQIGQIVVNHTDLPTQNRLLKPILDRIVNREDQKRIDKVEAYHAEIAAQNRRKPVTPVDLDLLTFRAQDAQMSYFNRQREQTMKVLRDMGLLK